MLHNTMDAIRFAITFPTSIQTSSKYVLILNILNKYQVCMYVCIIIIIIIYFKL